MFFPTTQFNYWLIPLNSCRLKFTFCLSISVKHVSSHANLPGLNLKTLTLLPLLSELCFWLWGGRFKVSLSRAWSLFLTCRLLASQFAIKLKMRYSHGPPDLKATSVPALLFLFYSQVHSRCLAKPPLFSRVMHPRPRTRGWGWSLDDSWAPFCTPPCSLSHCAF